MSKISNQLDKFKAIKSAEPEVLNEEARRDNFTDADEETRKTREMYEAGKKRRNVYDEINRVGIENGEYSVNLVNITLAKTANGNQVVRFQYRMADDYIFQEEAIRSLHFNTSSVDEFHPLYDRNFAWEQIGQLVDSLELDDSNLKLTTEDMVKFLSDAIKAGANEKAFNVTLRKRVTNTKTFSGDKETGTRQNIFYNVSFPDLQTEEEA